MEQRSLVVPKSIENVSLLWSLTGKAIRQHREVAFAVFELPSQIVPFISNDLRLGLGP
jgi:hypothetical protein